MKTIYFTLATIIMIMISSCSANDDLDFIVKHDVDETVMVSLSYNLSNRSVYSSSMTRSSSYVDAGDSVWTNVFKPAIENGILTDSTMNIKFTNLKDGLTTTISGKYGTPIILKKGKYAVSGTVGLEKGGSHSSTSKAIHNLGSLEVRDTVYVSEQNTNLSIKATVEYQALIISSSRFTVSTYDVSKYKNYWYIFVDTYADGSNKNDYYEYDFVFSTMKYTFKPIHNNFYYYGDSSNTTTYDIDMNNGHK